MLVKKVVVASVAAFLSVLLVTGAGHDSSAQTRTYNIKFSSGQPGGSPKVVAARRFGQLVEERTNGAVKFSYFDSGQLYADRDEPLAVRQGNVQMVVAALVFMDSIVPNTQVYGLPFMFGVDPRKAEALAKSEVGKGIERQVEQRLGAKVLGTWYTGTTMYSSSKRLRSVDDFKNLRIRVAGSKLWEEYAKALGGSPIAIAPAELFTAAQQGLIDANDSNATAIVNQKMYQVMKYGIQTNHSTILHAVIINGDFWKSLPPDVQKIMQDTAAEVTDWEWNHGIELLDAAYKTLEKEGVEVYKPTPAELAKFQERIQPLQDPYLKANTNIDAALVAKAQAFVR